MTQVATTDEVRAALSDMVNRVAFGGQRIVIIRRGKRVAMLVPIPDTELDRVDSTKAPR